MWVLSVMPTGYGGNIVDGDVVDVYNVGVVNGVHL